VTIASETNRISYTGNGATVDFSVSFPFQSAGDLVVVETIIATGVQTTKTITTHYTVSGTPDALGYYSNGGTVTAVTAPASTVTWTIYRDPDLLQSLNLSENNALPAESLEAQLDYVTMLVQRLHDRVSRSLRQPEGDSANIDYLPSKVDRASTYLAFDADGDPIATDGTTEANPVSSFMATVLDDTTGNAALVTLGTAASDPRLVVNTTHASNRRSFVDFQKNGTSKWVIATDFDGADDTQSLTVYDSEAALNRIQVTSDGTVKVYKILSLLEGALKFPATQNASADVNTLDDYEEGTWTPSVGGTATYTTQVGRYIKIGKQVTVWCDLVINAIGTGDTIIISGLPFAAVTLTGYAAIGAAYAVSSATAVVSIVGVVTSGASTITLGTLAAAGASISFANPVFQNSAAVHTAITYQAAN